MASLLQDAKAKVKKSKEEIIEDAVDFINQFYASVKRFFDLLIKNNYKLNHLKFFLNGFI